jgi:hypothetical protein
MEGLMTAEIIGFPNSTARAAASDEGCLSADDVRHMLFDIALDARLAMRAIDGIPDPGDEDDTLAAIRNLLYRVKQEAESVAGGPTFDRFRRLEDGEAVAS